MRQNVHDIIALSNKVEYPDISLAMTCNPLWLGINNVLLPDQNVVDHPDLAACVFCIELCALMAFFIDQKAFGNVKAYVRAIEFQK